MNKQYISHYHSPLGTLLLASDEVGLTGLWIEGQKYFAGNLDPQAAEKSLPVFDAAREWLDRYFSGEAPALFLPLHPSGTEFQKQVWEILCKIPYGETITYGEIAGELAKKRGVLRLSAQAVGTAVGHNPISIMIPCHRVVGAKGKLTGYAGGIDKKVALLRLEGAWKETFL